MGNVHLVTGYAGQPHVSSADQGSFNASLVGSGEYVLHNGNQFAASTITNNQIRVLDGDILMQGRHIRLNGGNYVDLTIENGQQGYFRNDLIVVRYTKNAETGVEDANLLVIKGAATTKTPADPAYTKGDVINNGDILNDMPLYRVPLDGLNVKELVPMFTVSDATPEQLLEAVNNAVKKTGDKMSGNLIIEKASTASFKATNKTSNRSAFMETGSGGFLYLTNTNADDSNSRVSLWLAPETATNLPNNLLRLNVKKDGGSLIYNVLHSGNIEAQGVAKIQVRTYYGNGKSGTANRNTLTFDFAPKIVIVGGVGHIPVVLVNGINQANQYSGWKNGNVIWTVAWNDATVEWFMYGTGVYGDGNGAVETGTDASGQMNESGKLYTAIAIG